MQKILLDSSSRKVRHDIDLYKRYHDINIYKEEDLLFLDDLITMSHGVFNNIEINFSNIKQIMRMSKELTGIFRDDFTLLEIRNLKSISNSTIKAESTANTLVYLKNLNHCNNNCFHNLAAFCFNKDITRPDKLNKQYSSYDFSSTISRRKTYLLGNIRFYKMSQQETYYDIRHLYDSVFCKRQPNHIIFSGKNITTYKTIDIDNGINIYSIRREY